MLTPKENMRRAVKGENPERFVNQYEAVQLLFHPFFIHSPLPEKGKGELMNAWGVTNIWPEGTPGGFPVHTPEKIPIPNDGMLPDIQHWRDYVHAPSLDFPEAEWEIFQAQWDAVDDDLAYKAPFIAPGLFEQTHHFMDMVPALMAYQAYPQEMHDLIAYLTEWELKLAEGICDHYHPTAIFHHDDWGSQDTTFLRPEMFAEFFVEPYKQIYGYYHERGCELVIHHSDSYAATLVPYMIEMGIDVWQGCMSENKLPELIKKYGGQISFMGGIDNKFVDFDGWTPENCIEVADRICDEAYEANGLNYFIPCITQGGPGSVYPGTYMELFNEIDRWNERGFGVKTDEIKRAELQIMF